MIERNIVVDRLERSPVEKGPVEIVERKGIGHPDSIADGLAESVSRALSKMYLEECGEILHHNVDKNEISGGQSAPRFGGGELIDPPYIILLGRAIGSMNIGRSKYKALPVRETAIHTAQQYLSNDFWDIPSQAIGYRFNNLNIKDVIIDCRIGKGSQDLIRNFERKAGKCGPGDLRGLCLPANDTSIGVSFAPYSETENLVLETERYMNGSMKREIKASGDDVKVMAERYGDKDPYDHCSSDGRPFHRGPERVQEHYLKIKEKVIKNAGKFTERELSVVINHADDYNGKDESDYYLTVTGLSMENGDDGSVGRGNRANGLITPYRPMSMEATAGKNPVTHVGKLYNILSHDIATEIAKEAGEEVREVGVWILSEIGSPIDHPEVASIQLITDDDILFNKWSKRARELADAKLAALPDLTRKIVNGEIAVF